MNESLFKISSAVKDFYEIPAVRKKLESNDAVRGAFELAYYDNQRTLKGIGKNPNNKLIKQTIFEILSKFYKDLSESFNHYSLRDYDGTLRMVYDKIVSASTELGHGFSYGQAQKVTNMFFKYMLLVDDRLNRYLNYFHVPLDSIILNGIANGAYSAEIRAYAKACMSWSKIEDFGTYMSLQDALRSLYENPILFEFEVWSQWKPQP